MRENSVLLARLGHCRVGPLLRQHQRWLDCVVVVIPGPLLITYIDVALVGYLNRSFVRGHLPQRQSALDRYLVTQGQ